MNEVKHGMVVGNGAAINVELGWVPDMVELYNGTDGDIATVAFLDWIVPFTSGGTTEIKPGQKVKGETSGAEGVVKQVELYSGSWAGGDAAGFLRVDGIKGTFGSENIAITENLPFGGTSANQGTVTANVVHNVAITTAAASATGNSAISRYEGTPGSGGGKKGFTIGATIAEEAKALRYRASRDIQ